MTRKMAAIVIATSILAAAGITGLLLARTGEPSAVPAQQDDLEHGMDTTDARAAGTHDLQPASSVPAAAPPAFSVMVEIQGAVAAPGMYSFPGNARVYDALEKAGGASENAEIRDINIAATLLDGSVLSIPYRQNDGQIALPGAADLNPPAYTRSGWRESPAGKVGPGSATSPGGVPDSPAKVNINTATQAELETLPGVGEKTAEKIMRHRETQPFTHVDDLGFVQGIGEKRLETLRPHVTVE